MPPNQKIIALVLAAGTSSRAGDINKLLINLQGAPMISKIVDEINQTSANRIVVVTGHDSDAIKSSLFNFDIIFAHNPNYMDGISSSLKKGFEIIHGLESNCDGVMICLGDMPLVSHEQLQKIINCFSSLNNNTICIPTFGGKRGNPVLIGKNFFTLIDKIDGDIGMRSIINNYNNSIFEIKMDNKSILMDIDTPEEIKLIQDQEI